MVDTVCVYYTHDLEFGLIPEDPKHCIFGQRSVI